MRNENHIQLRKELYDQVWAEPMRDLAKKFGMSDVGLAKICKKLNIPRPGRGYWNRKVAGIPVRKKPLPANWKSTWGEYQIFERLKNRDAPDFGDEATSLLKNEENASMVITVAEELVQPHKLVRKSAGSLKRYSKSQEEHRTKRACLDIRASRNVLDRALRIADSLIKALEEREFQVEVTDPIEKSESHYRPKPSRTGVHILGSFVEFAIEEGFTIAKVLPKRSNSWSSPEYKHTPNGKLALKVKSHLPGPMRETWADGKRQRVEKCLKAFIVEIIRGAERARLERIERERIRRLRQEEQQRRDEEARIRKLEMEKTADLESRVDEWARSWEILEFLNAIEASAISIGQDVSTESNLGAWLRWAREYAKQRFDDSLETNSLS